MTAKMPPEKDHICVKKMGIYSCKLTFFCLDLKPFQGVS